MSWSKEVTLWCEGSESRCERFVRFGYPRVDETRRYARVHEGWVHTDDGRDLCPDCAEVHAA